MAADGRAGHPVSVVVLQVPGDGVRSGVEAGGGQFAAQAHDPTNKAVRTRRAFEVAWGIPELHARPGLSPMTRDMCRPCRETYVADVLNQNTVPATNVMSQDIGMAADLTKVRGFFRLGHLAGAGEW